jgi:hypothetical protein
LISVGSHLERSFCIATPGSTSRISTPRRLKATATVSSIWLALGFSDEGGTTAPPDIALCRILIVSYSLEVGEHKASWPLPNPRPAIWTRAVKPDPPAAAWCS